MLTPQRADTWDTAVFYQLVHALAMLLSGVLASAGGGRWPAVAGWAFGLGVLLFSGSLYVLALDGPGIFGPVTPLGGLCFITGWLALAVTAMQRTEQ